MFSGYIGEEVGGWVGLQLMVTDQAAVVLAVLSLRIRFFSQCVFDCVFLSVFILSLILSLEAKLNLLHSYMNVTWIRIPSETRVR